MAVTVVVEPGAVGAPQSATFTSLAGPLVFAAVAPHPDGTLATDFCLQATDRIVEQFKPQPKIAALLCAIADRATPIEQALINVKEFRQLSTALGQQLDELGKFYGEFRNDESDADYRRRLLAFAEIVASKGTGEDLIRLLVTLDNGFAPTAIALVEHHPAGLIMTARVPLGGQLLGETFARLLKKTKAGGVGSVLLFEEQSALLFVWSGDVGAGWGEDGQPGSGGLWAEGV